MHIRSKPKFTCRRCGVNVEADAGRCYRCGVAYPASELRAVVLSPTAIPFYVVVVLAFITFWIS
jgi:ribosomal protein L40E